MENEPVVHEGETHSLPAGFPETISVRGISNAIPKWRLKDSLLPPMDPEERVEWERISPHAKNISGELEDQNRKATNNTVSVRGMIPAKEQNRQLLPPVESEKHKKAKKHGKKNKD